MNLSGDPEGIEALKKLKETNLEYLKFLLKEAQTVFEQQVEFKSEDGKVYLLKFDKFKKELSVEKK